MLFPRAIPYSTALHDVVIPARVRVGDKYQTIEPLRDRSTGGYAHLSTRDGLATAAQYGARLVNRAGLLARRAMPGVLEIEPVTLPTLPMLVAAGIDHHNQTAVDAFRDANMSGLAWAKIHDEECERRLLLLGWDGSQIVCNVGKCWCCGAPLGWSHECGWWVGGAAGHFIQAGLIPDGVKGPNDHNDGHHDYGTLLILEWDAEDPDPGPRPIEDRDPAAPPEVRATLPTIAPEPDAPAPEAVPGLGLRALELAQIELMANARERPSGSNRGTAVDKYLRGTIRNGKPLGVLGMAWCAAFVSWCIWSAVPEEHPIDWKASDGTPAVGYRAAVSELVTDARASGRWHDASELRPGHGPAKGDLLVMSRGGEDPRTGGTGHVAFVLSDGATAPGVWRALSGNDGDAVRESTRSIKDRAEPVVGWISLSS